MTLHSSSTVENLLFVTDRLIDLMTKEVEFLKNMQPEDIRELQEDKNDLARAYERYMEEIKAAPEILSQVDDSLKAKLRSATDRFNVAITENERSLRAVKSVSERLLNVIVNAVAEKQSGAAYSSMSNVSAYGTD
jgi:hypothetical protein